MNKYRNTKTVYKGTSFHSKKEALYARQLDMLMKAKGKDKVRGYLTQVKFSIDIGKNHICNYFADFEVYYDDGHIERVDVKGFKTDIYKLKKKLVEAIYGFKIIEV